MNQVYKVYASENPYENTYARGVGSKDYELKDHLGNVSVVVTDVKYATLSGLLLSTHATIKAYYNYYPFGMQMPKRYYPQDDVADGGYRYGFNGKEKDSNGEFGNTTYDFGARIYNPSIGRWLSLDPLAAKYPSLSPYNFVNNNPIIYVDPDGKRFIFALGACSDCSDKGYGESFIKLLRARGVQNLLLANTSGAIGKSVEKGSVLSLPGDQFFTLGRYSSKPFYSNRVVERYQSDSGGGVIPIYGNETIENTDSRIRNYYNNLKKELAENPLAEGEQFNLAGVSAGSVLTAQAALALANDGQVIDNLILIGSPISEGTELYDALKSNNNIKNVIFKNLDGDPLTGYGASDEKGSKIWEILKEGDKGPHVEFSNSEKVREKVADELVNSGVK